MLVRRDHGLSFIAGRPEWPPTYDWVRLGSPEEVEALDGPPASHDMVGAWAWIDEESGAGALAHTSVRIGIAEDEATGAAAVQLGPAWAAPSTFARGEGSRILAQPRDDGSVEIGGLSVLDEVREHPLPGAESG